MKKWVSVLAAGVGALSLAGGLVVAAGVSTAGATGGPTITVKPDIVAASAAGSPSGAAIKVSIKGTGLPKGKGEIAVSECNPGVLGGDPLACNQNPANLGLPGGPYLGNVNGSGNSTVKMAVVSGAVGDGSCSAGELCYLVVVENPTTSPVEMGLVAFGINPLA